jgi:hypothetical protein
MKKTALLIFTISLFFGGCRKQIVVPDDSLKQVFGTWNWLYTYEVGGGYSFPATSGTSYKRTYTDDGKFEYFKGSDSQQKMNYDFATSTLSQYKWAIEYRHKTFNKETRTTENIHLHGDTLFITQSCDTCYREVYIKQK